MKYFLIGIKGTGMSALATLLYELGHDVSGSDTSELYFTEASLQEHEIAYYPFNQAKLSNEYIYIIGNAYDETNPEVAFIKQKQYCYYYYHEFIGKVLKKEIIAISGTHGKTTTTSFLVQMLNHNISYIIGDGSGAGTNENKQLVLEACEYKDHFLAYHPKILVVNNIELDHPEYFKDLKQVIASFNKLAQQSELIIINGDDKNARQINHDNLIRVGQNQDSEARFEIKEVTDDGYQVVLKYLKQDYNIRVPFYGTHMIYNIVLAYVTALTLGVAPSLERLELPIRRMNEVEYGQTILVDDYAHHPTEIKCLYQSLIIKYPDYPIKVIFQPHTYTRTLKLKKDFKSALSLFDEVYLAEVFTSKREKYNLYKQLKINKIFNLFHKFDPDILKQISPEKKEVWVFLGAGTIDNYINEL